MWRLALSFLSGLFACTVMAGSIDFQIEESVADSFQVQGLQANFDFSQDLPAFSIKADSLTLPAPVGRISQVDFQCTGFRFQSEQLNCEQGVLSFEHALLGPQNLSIRINASQQFSSIVLDFSGLRWLGGEWSVKADWQQEQWRAELSAEKLDVEKLNSQIRTLAPDFLPALDLSGAITLDATLKGQQQDVHSVTSDVVMQSLVFSDADGALAAESLVGELNFSATREETGWRWQQQSQLNSGELYVSPIYLDINAHPLALTSAGHWQPDADQVTVSQWQFEQQAVLQADGELIFSDGKLSNIRTDIQSEAMQPLYKIWLQPFVFDTAVNDAQLQGGLQLSLVWQDANYDLKLQLSELTIKDNQQRFAINGLTGNLAWTNQDHILPIDLRWQSAGFYQIDLGAASLAATASKNQLTLSESLFLPVLDGELQLDEFQLLYPPDDSVSWSFEGLLKPVSMSVLSKALDWPILQGKLSGVIPAVSYQNHQVDVDGALLVKVFDGAAIIRDLQLSQPFGYTPRLSANVDIDQLDLQTLTNTFDFGRITGTINGYVRDLQLSNWRPVQFDAWFATDESADTKRRISQRAVNNLSQLGGGASGLLSRSFLRFFDDFSYQRLGFGCRLSNDVCEMRGVSDAEQGYHIVKGGGLPPWINVIGHNRRIDWPVLIERIQAANQSGGPVMME